MPLGQHLPTAFPLGAVKTQDVKAVEPAAQKGSIWKEQPVSPCKAHGNRPTEVYSFLECPFSGEMLLRRSHRFEVQLSAFEIYCGNSDLGFCPAAGNSKSSLEDLPAKAVLRRPTVTRLLLGAICPCGAAAIPTRRRRWRPPRRAAAGKDPPDGRWALRRAALKERRKWSVWVSFSRDSAAADRSLPPLCRLFFGRAQGERREKWGE